MRSRSMPILLALLAATFVAAGCGKSPTAPTNSVSQQDADDAAQQVGVAVAQGGSGGGAAAPSSLSRTRTEPGTSSLRPMTLASDTTFTIGAITWTLTRTWYDLLDNLQPSYNPVTTVRMHVHGRGVGNVATVTDTASYGSTGDLDVRGVAVAQDTLVSDGSRADTLQCSFVPRFRTGRVWTYAQGSESVAALKQLKPVASNPWPLSGTATWTLHVDRMLTGPHGSIAKHFDVDVTVTFNGTRFPNVTVTGGYHYVLDLGTGVIVRA